MQFQYYGLYPLAFLLSIAHGWRQSAGCGNPALDLHLRTRSSFLSTELVTQVLDGKAKHKAKKLTNIRQLIGRVFDLSAAVNSCYGFCILIFLVSRSVFVHYYCYKLINYFYHFVIGSLSKATDSNVLTNGRNLCIQSIRIYIQVFTCNTVLKEVFILGVFSQL